MNVRWMVLGCLVLTAGVVAHSEFEFHTPPSEWTLPRLFQSDIAYLGETKFRGYISYEKVPMSELGDTSGLQAVMKPYIELERKGTEGRSPYKYMSPNNAYWYTAEDIVSASGLHEGHVYVFNERDEAIRFDIKYYANYAKEFSWVNEKLLYGRFWLGRRGGIDFIFDVEKEEYTYRELVHDGLIPYQQVHGRRERFEHN